MRTLGIDKYFDKKDIKTNRITEKELDEMALAVGSYEALFSRRAMKYRSMGLNEKSLLEKDYKKLILEEYTFLKRPVIQYGDTFFVGNSKSVIVEANKVING